MAAWIGMTKRCGGISFFIFSTVPRPRMSARPGWTSMDRASTGSALTRIDRFRRSGPLPYPKV
jgi:hypothetical protein